MKKKSNSDKAIAYACRLFSIRARSESELRKRLSERGFSGTVVRRTVAFLEEKGIVSDLKFARQWVESRMRTKPKGNMVLRKELRQKGLSSAVIERVLSERGSNEGDVCRLLAKKKMEALEKIPKEKARRRLFDFLARRGFDFDLIEDAVRECADCR